MSATGMNIQCACRHGIPSAERRHAALRAGMLHEQPQQTCSSSIMHRHSVKGLKHATAGRVARRARQGVQTRAAETTSTPDASGVPPGPSIFWRVFAALMYLVPWLDARSLQHEVLLFFPSSFFLHRIPGPFTSIYFSSQFGPLIIFFVLFLAVVRNQRLHHFVRFNTMQAIMIDICVMLFVIIRSYLPAEIRWSIALAWYDTFSWTMLMSTVLYCVWFAIAGKYADIPLVSESVYTQVEQSQYG